VLRNIVAKQADSRRRHHHSIDDADFFLPVEMRTVILIKSWVRRECQRPGPRAAAMVLASTRVSAVRTGHTVSWVSAAFAVDAEARPRNYKHPVAVRQSTTGGPVRRAHN
jgi:hypothetical protein